MRSTCEKALLFFWPFLPFHYRSQSLLVLASLSVFLRLSQSFSVFLSLSQCLAVSLTPALAFSCKSLASLASNCLLSAFQVLSRGLTLCFVIWIQKLSSCRKALGFLSCSAVRRDVYSCSYAVKQCGTGPESTLAVAACMCVCVCFRMLAEDTVHAL